jgi:hypothetical protein
VPSRYGGCLCVSSFLCSLLLASSLLPMQVQLALVHRLRLRLRPRSPAPSTSSGSRRCFARSWRATARPRVSGSAASSSATLIASNVNVLSADPPFGSQSPPLGNLGRVLFSSTARLVYPNFIRSRAADFPTSPFRAGAPILRFRDACLAGATDYDLRSNANVPVARTPCPRAARRVVRSLMRR